MTKLQTILRYVFVLSIGAGLAVSCAGTDKFQDKMKGLWTLQSRTLADGTKLVPPSISGRFEWFPMDVAARTAHVSVLTTHGAEGLQIHGSHYALNDYKRFSQESYLQVGGGISKTHDKTYAPEKASISGNIEVEGSQITIRHDNGLVYVFKGSTLTISHQDGTTDILTK
jgi:hypothetical protein